MITGQVCRGVVREVRPSADGHWYKVARMTEDGVVETAKPIAERRLTAKDSDVMARSAAPAAAPSRAAKFKLGDLVTWVEGRHARERQGRVEAIQHERGFGHTYLVRNVTEDGQPGKQTRQFAEAELAAPKAPEADLIPPDELARRLAVLKEQIKR